MRKESRVMKQCALFYNGLNMDRVKVLHKTKLLLEIYRTVVWSTKNRFNEVCETAACYYSKSLEHALEYLENFASDIEREKFQHKVYSLFETNWLISMIDSAMSKIYEYPDNGKLYHEILVKQYMTVMKYSEQEMLELLNMERSTYYDKKREAIDLLAICLWGYTIPALKGVVVGHDGESIPSFFYQSVSPD